MDMRRFLHLEAKYLSYKIFTPTLLDRSRIFIPLHNHSQLHFCESSKLASSPLLELTSVRLQWLQLVRLPRHLQKPQASLSRSSAMETHRSGPAPQRRMSTSVTR